MTAIMEEFPEPECLPRQSDRKYDGQCQSVAAAVPGRWSHMQRVRKLFSIRAQLFAIALACMDAVPGLAQSHAATPSMWAPASTPAHEIFGLSMFVLSITGSIFVIVAGLLAFVIFKFRERGAEANQEPAQIYGSMQVELAWTVIPVLIIVVLFLTTARIIFAIQDAPEPPSALDVTVIGHQFWWEFRYPQAGHRDGE